MGTRYPNQVGRHKPCVPVDEFKDPGPRVDRGHDDGRCVLR